MFSSTPSSSIVCCKTLSLGRMLSCDSASGVKTNSSMSECEGKQKDPYEGKQKDPISPENLDSRKRSVDQEADLPSRKRVNPGDTALFELLRTELSDLFSKKYSFVLSFMEDLVDEIMTIVRQVHSKSPLREEAGDDFSEKLTIMKTEFKGRSVFVRESSKPIKRGNLLFTERPIFQANASKHRILWEHFSELQIEYKDMFFAGWLTATSIGQERDEIANMCVPPTKATGLRQQAEKVLSALRQRSYDTGNITAETLERHALLWKYNSWDLRDSDADGTNLALYKYACSMAHSCKPNCVAITNNSVHGFSIKVETLRNIAPAEELSVSYLTDCELRKKTEERRDMLLNRFGFLCHCAACSKHKLARPLGSWGKAK